MSTNKRKTNDIRKYNMKIIEETLNKDTITKIAERKNTWQWSQVIVFFKRKTTQITNNYK